MESSAPNLVPPALVSPAEPPSGAPPSAGFRLFEDLESSLQHRFSRPALLQQALTHSSLAHEAQDSQERDQPAALDLQRLDNERLEFLGDAVLGMITAECLYRRYPELSEGSLTRLRGALVSRKHLAEVGSTLKLGQYLLLGRGEERSGGRSKSALLANAMEAVLGALYLDAGLETARRIVEDRVIEPSVATLRQQLGAAGGTGDYKSALQELLQAGRQGQPEYRITAESGPDHRKRFVVEVSAAGAPLALGTGGSRKRAEQEAARRALDHLRTGPSDSAKEGR